MSNPSEVPVMGNQSRNGPPKIAYIMSRFPKISETFVLYEMEALESMGMEVAVYPLLRERHPVSHPEAEKWVRRAHFHPFISAPIIRAQGHFLRHQPATYLRVWLEALRKTWGSTNFFVGALGILPKVIRFAQRMQEQKITHIHAHFATHPAVAALIIHRLTGIPFSFTAHGSDLHVDRRMLDAKVDAAAFVVTVSEYNKEVMISTCGEQARNKIHIVHCGVDPAVFTPRPLRRNDSTQPFNLVCVASFEEVKGHRYLVEACRLLRERGVEFRCNLVGEGPLRTQIERQIATAGLEGRVIVHGGQPRPTVIRLLGEADAAVLASHPTEEGKREGIPVALMEAMASGLPVVASAISGIPELVEDGQTGLLTTPRDSVALADAVQRLIENDEFRFRLGTAARKKIVRDFNLRTSTLKLLALFHGAKTPKLDVRPGCGAAASIHTSIQSCLSEHAS